MPKNNPVFTFMDAEAAEDMREKLSQLFNKQYDASMSPPEEGADPVETRKSHAQAAIAATQTADSIIQLNDYVLKNHIDPSHF